ncbi:HAD-IB family hydrolase [Paractinoplanes lichenicola]|uniref:HAD-IB family hydrolase n=1 Tax=Paractinoplanes lichenicola TaxID=2802976 RepID=A0ABS1W0J4_9ACTN|nr:HAD-IB family hydrolase [Actinoplanes lichenicola]MBL7260230.1 HAD-IB family hydrolase [Actinoplanes lichenicola]
MRPPLTVIEQPVVLPPSPVPVPGRGGVAAWDVDGTLVFGDTLLPFLRRFVGTAALSGILLDVIARNLLSRDAAKAALLQRVLGGRELAEVDAVARDYTTTLMHRTRPGCLRRWQWHRNQGHRLVLASASPDLYLTHLGSRLGADAVLSTTMEVVNGRVTGRMIGPNCRGEHKASRLLHYLSGHPTNKLWAYGNSRADEPMLALADVAERRPGRITR